MAKQMFWVHFALPQNEQITSHTSQDMALPARKSWPVFPVSCVAWHFAEPAGTQFLLFAWISIVSNGPLVRCDARCSILFINMYVKQAVVALCSFAFVLFNPSASFWVWLEQRLESGRGTPTGGLKNERVPSTIANARRSAIVHAMVCMRKLPLTPPLTSCRGLSLATRGIVEDAIRIALAI